MSSSEKFVLHSNSLPKKNYTLFEDMRRKGILCDITFKVGERSVSAHRIVLAAGIPYFQDTIYNVAATEGFEKEMEMPKIDYPALEALIEFVYSCKITITLENVKDLLSAACALHVEEVRGGCCKFLKDRLDPNTVLDIRHYAHSLKCMDLVHVADYYIRKHFDEVAQSESFLNLPFSFLEELISKDDLRVSSEEKVFESVIRWVKYSPTERCAELPELLKNVRLTLLNPRYLSDHIGSHEFIRASIPCRDLLDEAKNYYFFLDKRQEVYSFSTEPRNFKDTEERKTEHTSYTTECSSRKKTRKRTRKNKPKHKVETETSGICKIEVKTTFLLQCFDSERNVWNTRASRSISHKNGFIIELNDKVYSVYEFVSLQYDLANNDLQFFPRTERSYAGAAVLDGYLYVCGGRVSTATNLVEKYDPETKKWVEGPDMISCRSSPGVVSFRGCIYALGGMNNHNDILRGVEKYSVESQKWTVVEPMLIRRYGLASAVLNDKIYVCGGVGRNGYLNTAEVFDPVTKKWQFISSMNSSRYTFNLLPCCGKLYALGGYSTGTTALNTVELYDPETGKWLCESSMDSRSISGAVVLSGSESDFGILD